MLKGEMENHLGYGEYERNEKAKNNNRNGYSVKILKTTMGEIPVKIPRDREGSLNYRL